MLEEWKAVVGYEGLYEISNFGNVKSKYKRGAPKKEKYLSQAKTGKGYLCVSLYKNGKAITKKVHRLVAEAFIPNPDNKREVNHIDGDKLNSRVDNLEWVTPKENIEKSWEIGLSKKLFGEEAPRSRIVNQYDLNGNFIRQWKCIMYIQRELGYLQGNISSCCRGRKTKAYGYIWRYAD